MVLEEQLARALGMSRTPVREALVRLAQEDLVEIVPRRGMRVKPFTMRDLREIDEVLACLEVQAAERLATRRPTDEERDALQAAIDGMDAALQAEDMEAWAEADFRFHTLLIEFCGNAHLTRTAKLFLDKAHRARLATLPYRKAPVYSNSNHAAVVEAIKRGDAQTAREIHLAHKRRWSSELNEIANHHPILSAATAEEGA
jgi:DNA-binding GntR family transcriptional regulator